MGEGRQDCDGKSGYTYSAVSPGRTFGRRVLVRRSRQTGHPFNGDVTEAGPSHIRLFALRRKAFPRTRVGSPPARVFSFGRQERLAGHLCWSASWWNPFPSRLAFPPVSKRHPRWGNERGCLLAPMEVWIALVLARQADPLTLLRLSAWSTCLHLTFRSGLSPHAAQIFHM